MVSHAKSGGNLEIMGLLQGKFRGDAFYITDCFRLPVEGTETRVNAGEAANEYLVAFTELNEETEHSSELVCGWYHSHPGYGCWLSGIDVATQALYQEHQEPFVAIVIDPIRTSVSGKVEIGAFRTFPPGFVAPEDEGSSGLRGIPAEKVAEFGVHCKQYYQLEIEFYKSDNDSVLIEHLWKTYWVDVLAQNNWADERKGIVSDINSVLAKAMNQSDTDINSFTNKLHNCTCQYLHGYARQVVLARVLGAPRTVDRISSEMDTSV